MRISHYDRWLEPTFALEIDEEISTDGEMVVKAGTLTKDGKSYSVVDFIPRFVSESNYADSFGLQWNKFRTTQLDSETGISFTIDNFWKNTKWSPDSLREKNVLEVGSGAGRYTEVLLAAGAKVVSFDYSNAVDANYKNNSNSNLLLFQGDLYNIPLPNQSFDFVFCYGVLQHTPDPERSFHSIMKFLKPGGNISVDLYKKYRLPSPYSTPKYLWRPITTKMNPETLLRIIRFYIPLYLPIQNVLCQIPRVGGYIAALIPIPCWVHLRMGLSWRQQVDWSIMNTFDALSPTYDFPQTKDSVTSWCEKAPFKEFEVFFGSNGIVANGVKA